MKNLRLVSILGARPQFVKGAAVSEEIRKNNKRSKTKINEKLVHTGQHYNVEMSDLFFNQLEIPRPDYNLGVRSEFHGEQTALMITGIEKILIKERPDLVIVYGDTNSTLAGALSAAKLHIPIAHIEAGLRSFNKQMPEEINRIITDHLSDFLFCPTKQSIVNLKKEGITKNVYLVGDIMKEMVLKFCSRALRQSQILKSLCLTSHNYYLATIHRAENVDCPEKLKTLMEIFEKLDLDVILPLHPRTQNKIKEFRIKVPPKIRIIMPVSYFDMLVLEKNAKIILTDSGGVQKEAFLFGTPCITLREETEWVETVVKKRNILTGVDKNKILNGMKKFFKNDYFKRNVSDPYGDGYTSNKIIKIIKRNLIN